MKIETDSEGTITYSPEDGVAHTASIILIHGFSGNARNMTMFADAWSQLMPFAKFIMPTAGERETTRTTNPRGMPLGRTVRSWCDIGRQSRTPGAGLAEARDRIMTLLIQEHSLGIPYSRMVVMGFSQGSVVTLFTGLQMPAEEMKLAGLVIISGTFPFRNVNLSVNPAHKKIPIFQANASDDEIAKPMGAKAVKNRLWWQGVTNISLKWYTGGHALRHNNDCVSDAGAFIAHLLPPV